ncbi:hypothetical protein DRO64_02025 [Candidatus Bathyarchaeota archaeon]|nr:MAG: hypothetical protein DRO64_02025 [Candidatus Bathyarchaeota archaeon]
MHPSMFASFRDLANMPLYPVCSIGYHLIFHDSSAKVAMDLSFLIMNDESDIAFFKFIRYLVEFSMRLLDPSFQPFLLIFYMLLYQVYGREECLFDCFLNLCPLFFSHPFSHRVNIRNFKARSMHDCLLSAFTAFIRPG